MLCLSCTKMYFIDSEVIVQFQRLPKSSKTSEMFSDSMSSPTAPCEDSMESLPDLKKDTTIASDRLFLSDIPPNSQASSKTKSQSQKGRSRKDSDSQSDNDLGTSTSARSSSHTKTSRNKSASGNHSVDKDGMSPVHRDSSSETRRKPVYSEKKKIVDDDDEDDDDDDEQMEDNNSEDSEEEIRKPEPKKRGPPRKGKVRYGVLDLKYLCR